MLAVDVRPGGGLKGIVSVALLGRAGSRVGSLLRSFAGPELWQYGERQVLYALQVEELLRGELWTCEQVNWTGRPHAMRSTCPKRDHRYRWTRAACPPQVRYLSVWRGIRGIG